MASWAVNTRRQYDSNLKAWNRFVKVNEAQTLPLEGLICEYLQELHNNGRSVATIASHKAALTTALDVLEGQERWSNNPLVSRFMKGMFRIKPPKTKLVHTWDVQKVLDALSGAEDNTKIDLAFLTRKVTFLLAICSPRRVSELAALNLKDSLREAERWTFFLEYRNKNRSSGPAHKAVYEVFPENPKICPVRCMAAFLRRTETLRRDDRLLISSKTGRGVSPSTVSAWVKDILAWAGLGDKRAHSTRSAATSRAFASGVPLNKVLEAACWSKTSSTFQRFYNKELPAQSFQNAVLSRCFK